MHAVAQEKPKFAGCVLNDPVEVVVETEALSAWNVLVLLTVELRTFESLNSAYVKLLRCNCLLNVSASLGMIYSCFLVLDTVISMFLQLGASSLKYSLDGFL